MKNLDPHGTLDTLHPNGLIAYEDIPVRADGLPKRTACNARVRALERKIDALKEAAAKKKGAGKDKARAKEMKALMEAHDAALDELAMFALEEDDGAVDDFDALMAGLEDGADLGAGPSRAAGDPRSDDEWKGIGDSDDESGSELILGGNKDDEGDSDEEDEDDGALDAMADERDDASREPSSFSRIPTAYLHQHLGLPTTAALPADSSTSDFPGLRKAATPYVVELSAGEMLYLPASWWHEVTSTSAGGAKDDVHMAFNYWFYPPDALDRFEAPYQDELVWDYLRSKAGRDVEVRSGDSEKVRAGKRVRKDGEPSSKKKAKR